MVQGKELASEMSVLGEALKFYLIIRGLRKRAKFRQPQLYVRRKIALLDLLNPSVELCQFSESLEGGIAETPESRSMASW